MNLVISYNHIIKIKFIKYKGNNKIQLKLIVSLYIGMYEHLFFNAKFMAFSIETINQKFTLNSN